MACSITISAVKGVGVLVSPPTLIRVSGTATDCNEVRASAYCQGLAFFETTSVASDGTWTVDLPAPSNSGCRCGRQIYVQASCVEDPSCTTLFSGVLECLPAEGCPAVTVDVTIGDCNADGTRSVAFTTSITPPPASGVAEWDFGDGLSGPAFSFTAPTSHVETHSYAAGGPYTAQLLIVLPQGCPPVSTTVGPIPPCECPEVVGLTATVMGCAGAGTTAAVSFAGLVPGMPLGCSFHWEFGDGSPEVTTTTPTVTHIYTAAGTFPVAVTLICGACVQTTTIDVIIPPCCPVLTGLSGTVSGCADGMGTSATVTFVTATNPPGAVGSFIWTFDDGSPPQTTVAPTVIHSYTIPGTKVIEVLFTPAQVGCSASFASSNVAIPSCGGEVLPPPGGEGGGCKGLRWAAVILSILAALSFYICICIGITGFCWAAVGLAGGAAILSAIWAVFCPNKPCNYGLLFAWQIALGAGIGALYFAPCCAWLWVVGAGLIIAGITMLLIWAQRCRKTFCQVIAELVVVITVVIIPVLDWLGLVPAISSCLNPIVRAAVTTFSGAIALALAACASD